MKTINYPIIAIAVFVIAISPLYPQQDDTPKTGKTAVAINSAEEAIGKALEYTGFGALKNFDMERMLAEPRLITFVDTTTPFLAEKANGLKAWHIRFNKVSLQRDNDSLDIKALPPKDFNVYLDAKAGVLLKIESSFEMDFKSRDLVPNLKDSENHLLASDEKYTGFPDSIPAITFYEAISKPRGGGLMVARQIIANLVMHSTHNSREKAVWVITLRGVGGKPVVSPMPPHTVYKVEWRDRKARIDASTGKLIYVTEVAGTENTDSH